MSNPAKKRKMMSTTDQPEQEQEEQSFQARAAKEPIEDGVIEKLLLVDFMCHARLEVELNPCVNFILGQNGSGKSAIMTAIIVALGGKAATTQRAQSLKDLIRTGCSQAEIHLTLFNKGYKTDEYGSSITVICTIRKDGITNYRIKSKSGNIVSTHKDELLRILDHFNIQVDNPVCMLSQDNSRHFLYSSTPSARFKLFMKATYLQKKVLDLNQAKEQQELMKREIERKKEMLLELEIRAKQCEDELCEIENLTKLEEKECHLNVELLWAQVRDVEQKVAKTEREIDKEEQKLENIKKQRDELADKKIALDREVQSQLKKIRSLQHEMTLWMNEKAQFQSKLTEIINEARLNQAQQEMNDSLSGFAPWMTDLVTALNNNRRQFIHFPKGPIGSCIKVKEQKWCFAIECCIGVSNLYGFVVDNHEDETKLKGIIRDVLRRHPNAYFPSCLTSKFMGRSYDVSRNLPRCNHPVLLNMIQVNDPDILNVLVDMCSIETTLLIEQKDEARHVMDHPPTNAKSCYTIEGDQVLPDRYYSNKRKHPYGILHASKEASIVEHRRCLEELRVKVRDLQSEGDRLIGLVQSKARDQASIKRYISTSQSKKRELNSKKSELQTQIEELDDANEEEDIATWEREILELDGKLREQEEKVSQVKDVVKEKRRELKDLEEETNTHSHYMQETSNEVETARDQFKVASNELQRVTNLISENQNRSQVIERKMNEIKTRQEKETEEYRIATDTAGGTGERIETDRSINSIQSEIDKIQALLQKQSHKRDNQAKARQDYIDARRQFDETDNAIRKEKLSLTELNTSLSLRILGYKEIRQRIATRACLYFKNIISRRGYTGTLLFDIKSKKLEIIVKVRKEQATKNIRSLSGGERSFSTVAFIMALWEAMECPFRCLDEFDVFMDLMNRRISMQLMLEGAEQQKGKQFIFLTPQDMSSLGITFPERCKTLRLNAPDRTQRTLD